MWQTGGLEVSTRSTPLRGLDGDAPHQVRIVAVGRAEMDVEPHEFVGMGPVHHLVGDQVLVRDQVFLPVPRHHAGVARAKRLDPSERVAEADDVARLDRLVEQDDDPRDEVRHHLLQAEAEADTDRPRQDGKARQVHADRPQADDDGRAIKRDSA
jgi:hypothetical protein